MMTRHTHAHTIKTIISRIFGGVHSGSLVIARNAMPPLPLSHWIYHINSRQIILIMKKSFFTLMLMLMSAIAINAQSLTAHQWGTKLISEDKQEVLVELTFEKNETCELQVGAEHQIKEDGVPINILGSVAVPGTYTLNDKDLTMDLDKGKAEVDFDYEIKGMDAKTKALMDKQIRSDLNGLKGEFKNTMLNGMPKMHNMKIVSLTNKELILQIDNGKEMPFYAL